MFTNSRISGNTMFEFPSRELMMEMRWKPNNTEVAPNCPRCASANTKFCYYNNYSLSQPRYFCKGCRRYWTKGGSLRNVPVGGGCRKSRKSKSSRQAKQRTSGLSYRLPGPCSTSDESNSTSAVNIDLATIFTKFLNQDSSNEVVDEVNVSILDQESSSSGVSYNSLDLPPNSFDTENHHQMGNVISECQKPYDFIDGAQMYEGLPPLYMECGNNVEELLDQNCDALNLQPILGDEIVEDTHHLLSDGTSLPNLEWQSIMQFQDLGSSSFSTDDEMKIPSNVADDHWSSFDLSGYEIFPRHWNYN